MRNYTSFQSVPENPMAEGKSVGSVSGGGNSVEPLAVGDVGGISLMDFCVQLDDCTPTVCGGVCFY